MEYRKPTDSDVFYRMSESDLRARLKACEDRLEQLRRECKADNAAFILSCRMAGHEPRPARWPQR